MNATPQLENLATNPNGFAFDSASGASYQISELGMEMIAWIREGLSEKELTDRVVAEYEIDPLSAERDLTLFIANLRALGLVE